MEITDWRTTADERAEKKRKADPSGSKKDAVQQPSKRCHLALKKQLTTLTSQLAVAKAKHPIETAATGSQNADLEQRLVVSQRQLELQTDTATEQRAAVVALQTEIAEARRQLEAGRELQEQSLREAVSATESNVLQTLSEMDTEAIEKALFSAAALRRLNQPSEPEWPRQGLMVVVPEGPSIAQSLEEIADLKRGAEEAAVKAMLKEHVVRELQGKVHLLRSDREKVRNATRKDVEESEHELVTLTAHHQSVMETVSVQLAKQVADAAKQLQAAKVAANEAMFQVKAAAATQLLEAKEAADTSISQGAAAAATQLQAAKVAADEAMFQVAADAAMQLLEAKEAADKAISQGAAAAATQLQAAKVAADEAIFQVEAVAAAAAATQLLGAKEAAQEAKSQVAAVTKAQRQAAKAASLAEKAHIQEKKVSQQLQIAQEVQLVASREMMATLQGEVASRESKLAETEIQVSDPG